MSKPKLLSTGELAAKFGVTSRTIARYVQEGKLHPTSTTLGGQYRWDINDAAKQWKAFQQRKGSD